MYNRKYFTQIWGDKESFLRSWYDSGFNGDPMLTDDAIRKIYLHLMARYKNSPIAYNDETQFEFRVFSMIEQYGPTWAKKLELQKKARALTDDEIVVGPRNINNHANNPSTLPSTASLEELQKIDMQSTNITKRAKLDAYGSVYNMLKDDITKTFIDRFKVLFMPIVAPQHVPLWIDEEEE